MVQGRGCLVSWTNVCRPRPVGGLGIADMRTAGFALCLRWLWLHHSGHPYWANLKAPLEQSVSDMIAASTFVLGDNTSTLFWTGQWIEGRSVDLALDLLHIVPPRLRASRTVALALADNSWVRDISSASCPALFEHKGPSCLALDK